MKTWKEAEEVSKQKPGHLFEALVSQAQLSIFIQVTPVLMVTGVQQQQAEDTQKQIKAACEEQRSEQRGGRAAERLVAT